MSKKKTHEEFVLEIQKMNPPYIILSKYINCKTKVKCKCKICGYEWSATPNNLLRGQGCIICSNKKSADKRRKSNDQFLYELCQITNTIVPLEEYKGALTKISVKCTDCGRIWMVEPHSLLQGKGCNVCSSIVGGLKQRKTHQQFVKELCNKYPSLVLNSKYTTMHSYINFTCNECNNTFDRLAADIFYNGGCPICNIKSVPQRQPKPLKQFVLDLQTINPDIQYIDGYQKASSKVHVKCKVCGHDWLALGTSLTSGFGCPVCCMSHGEKRIKDFLNSNNITYIPQKTFSNLIGVGGGDLSYDFYLPNYNLLIEYQGEYHDGTANNQTEIAFLKQQEHDKRKREYAARHIINLLEIWYYDYNNIENILIDYFKQYNDLYFENPVTTTVI